MNRLVHTPVMLKEVVNYLKPGRNKKYLDATLGAGGHSLALLAAGATVTGIDRDEEIIKLALANIRKAGYSARFRAVHSNFAAALLKDTALDSDYDGILFDLGVSSLQLDTPSRGFSFRFAAPLDMRMDPGTQQVTARDLVNGLGKKELHELFMVLGEEKFARRLAEALCGARRLGPIETTTQLAEIVEAVIPRSGRLHPATKVFQALRMAVNTEREELKAALPSALSRLEAGGVLAVISFHSGEDRVVKNQFASWQTANLATPLSKKPLTPSAAELKANPRARSAKLRAARKIANENH